MVRLKVSRIPSSSVRFASFQFHYGTIKRPEEKQAEAEKEKFQFHYGTIKRFPLLSLENTLSNFNSTMVRLKDTAGPDNQWHII